MDDQNSGYMYCCSVEDLRQTISYLPDLSNAEGVWPDVINDKPLPEYVEPGTCVIDLDLRPEMDLPLYFQNGDFLYPEREHVIDGDGHRLVYVGEY